MYFAQEDSDKILGKLCEKIDKFHKTKDTTGEAKRWRKSRDLYYGQAFDGIDGTSIGGVGEDSELSAYGVNHYRNLIKHVLALTCSQKPAYDFRAINSDLRSQQQARLANNIVESYLTEKRLGRYMKQSAERCLVFKEAFVYMPWDTSLGRDLMAEPAYDAETGEEVLDDDGDPVMKIKKEGDVNPMSLSPWDVVRDVHLRDWANNKWVIVRTDQNKYDVAAQYPQYKDKIESLDADYDNDLFDKKKMTTTMADSDENDLISVYEFYHLPTAALPSGRYVKFLGDEINLYDGAYPYIKKSGNNKLPVHRIVPGEMFESAEGYSEAYDIMALQQVANVLYSTFFTNQQAFGVQAIWMPDGCGLAAEQIGKGLVVLKGGPPGSQPIPLQLTSTPAEIFKSIEKVEQSMERLLGLNSAVTGADSSQMSGIALGRMQAMAIQFSSNFQQAWAELQEDSGTWLLNLLQVFAKTDRMVAIAGKNNKGAMQSFKGEDIDLIDRVVCDLGNPLSRVYAGRMDMAEKLIDKGLIKDPQMYIELINTGNIEPMLKGPTSKIELIAKENEALMEGKVVDAMVGDSHIQHAQEHRVIMDDPSIRAAAQSGDELAVQILNNTLSHIMQHKQLEETQEPFWFAVSGEQPPPPQQQGQPPQGGSAPPSDVMPQQAGAPELPPLPMAPPV